MMKFKVTFYPDNRTVEVEKDRTVLSAALSAGVFINSSCGGDGVCGRCKVILRKGTCVMLPTAAISPQDKKRGVWLACLTTVQSDCEIEVLPEARLEFDYREAQLPGRLAGEYSPAAEDIQQADIIAQEQPLKHAPLTEKVYLELAPPSLSDHISDLDRLYRAIYKAKGLRVSHTGLVNVRLLPDTLRDAAWKVTATLARRQGMVELLGVEAGNTECANFGFAFDIGTTTVSGQLINLSKHSIMGTKAAYNKQAVFGADVITRIIYAQKAEGLEKLHSAVIESINGIIHALVCEHSVDPNDVTSVMCAGNTTMMHLLLRIDPSSIRREPYVPVVNNMPVVRCSEAGLAVNPRALLYCAAGIASYVGGDVTAGVLACGMHKSENNNLLIDIGTNGEIALGNREFLVATAASAGPAFEGSGVSCGMRASAGAIQKISIAHEDFSVAYETIGDKKPRGICGSGYIGAIAAMLRAGVLDKNGKLRLLPGRVRRNSDGGLEFIVAEGHNTETSRDIVITEADIENIKRAKSGDIRGYNDAYETVMSFVFLKNINEYFL